MKTLRLLITFYRSFAIISIIITLCCMSIMYFWGKDTFTALVWFKIASLAMIFYTISDAKSDSFSYYKNLGLSKLFLWTTTFAFDFLLFQTILITILKTR